MTPKGRRLSTEAASTSPEVIYDPVEFEEFYRRYFLPLVRRATWKHRLEKEDARDVVQEAFVVALAKLNPNRNPKAWLIQVVDHLSVNFQRKVVRRAKLVSMWSPAEIAIASRGRLGESSADYDFQSDPEGGDD